MEKKMVSVMAEFSEDGKVTPKTLLWEDGRKFSIDRVLDVRKAASLKSGITGVRYTCMIHGQQTYLFKDEDIWFIESV